jgi:hypothetical protein
MPQDAKFKKAVRERMASTGENYTTARRALLEELEVWAAFDEWKQETEADVDEKTPPMYMGEIYDHTPYGEHGGAVHYTCDDAEPGVLAGKSVDWSDDNQRRNVIRAVMEHHLGKPPSSDAVESFLEEYRQSFRDGDPFEIPAGAVAHLAY